MQQPCTADSGRINLEPIVHVCVCVCLCVCVCVCVTESDDIMVINMTTWLQFCTECKIIDNTQKGTTANDLQVRAATDNCTGRH